jgi:hypothetical protein
VELAASLGAAISMGLSAALSDDGSVTGRGSPLRRRAITGVATGLGGMLHNFPLLIRTLGIALKLMESISVASARTTGPASQEATKTIDQMNSNAKATKKKHKTKKANVYAYVITRAGTWLVPVARSFVLPPRLQAGSATLHI